jgi:hypothetical protein
MQPAQMWRDLGRQFAKRSTTTHTTAGSSKLSDASVLVERSSTHESNRRREQSRLSESRQIQTYPEVVTRFAGRDRPFLVEPLPDGRWRVAWRSKAVSVYPDDPRQDLYLGGEPPRGVLVKPPYWREQA